MPFLVEDGTGVEGATSLVPIAFADDYFALRGKTAWAALDTSAKETALIVGTEYFELRYSTRLRGRVSTSAQSLSFPRIGCYDKNGYLVEGVPEDVKKAVSEYALLSSASQLYPEAVTTAKDVKRTKSALDGLQTEVEYFGNALATQFIKHNLPDGLVAPFVYGGVASGGGTIRN